MATCDNFVADAELLQLLQCLCFFRPSAFIKLCTFSSASCAAQTTTAICCQPFQGRIVREVECVWLIIFDYVYPPLESFGVSLVHLPKTGAKIGSLYHVFNTLLWSLHNTSVHVSRCLYTYIVLHSGRYLFSGFRSPPQITLRCQLSLSDLSVTSVPARRWNNIEWTGMC